MKYKNKKVLIFAKQCRNKNTLHKKKRPINIDKVDTKRKLLSQKDLYIFKVKKTQKIIHVVYAYL